MRASRSALAVAVAAALLAGCASRAPDSAAPAAAAPYCVNDTGTRIPASGGHCPAGLVLTHEELERTGETDLNAAVKSRVPN